MKLKTHAITLAAILMSAVALPAVAAPKDFFGDPAPQSAATHQIQIDSKTKYVNVTGGDVVKFVVGDKTFTWNFDVAESVNSFDLNQVAPNGMLDHAVTVYVAPDPQWIG